MLPSLSNLSILPHSFFLSFILKRELALERKLEFQLEIINSIPPQAWKVRANERHGVSLQVLM